MTNFKRILILSYILILFACSVQEETTNLPEVDNTKLAEIIQCKEPRKQMCTREYRPVCATKDNGVRCVTTPCDSTDEVTYANACTACADEEVYHYVPGQCKANESE